MWVKFILLSMCLATVVSAYGNGGQYPVHQPVKPTPYKPKPIKYVPKTTKYVPKHKPVVHHVPKPKPICYGYKKVLYNYYYGYNYYGYNSYNYNTHGLYFSTCRKLAYESNRGKCQNRGYGGGYAGGYNIPFRHGYYGYGYTDCKSHYCGGYVYEGQSKCHGKVKLSKGYYYKGEQCSYENGSCGYKPYSGYHTEMCNCETKTCSKSVKACYKYGYYYYEGYVKIEYPCGCQCSSAPNMYTGGDG